MSKNKTYDPLNSDSVSAFATELCQIHETQVEPEFIEINVVKAINELKKLDESKYKDERTRQLIRLILNIVFFGKVKFVFDKIVSAGLYPVYVKIIDYHVKQSVWDYDFLLNLFFTLSSLTFNCSENAAKENINHGLLEKGFEVFRKGNFLSANNINNNQSYDLYHKLILFFTANSTTDNGKEKLIELGIVDFYLNYINEINQQLVNKPDLAQIKVQVILALSNLLKEEEMDKLPISNDLVNTMVDRFKTIVENGKKNQRILQNTKYYAMYTINNSTTYSYASGSIDRLLTIAVNDSIKQKLFDANVLDYLYVLLQNGNNSEVDKSCELICSLCFNNNVKNALRANDKYIELIKEKMHQTENDSTKRSCQQIVDMVNQVVEKRIASAKIKKPEELSKSGHIMISYNHKYSEKVLEINDKLKEKGFTTWIDCQTTFSDLYDALAKAIENARVVLICYSQEYKDSGNCRYEANYALKLMKPIIALRMQHKYNPDGWLGMAIAEKLYIDFAHGPSDSDSYTNLFKQIDLLLNNKTSVTPLERPPSRVASAAKRTENAEKWNQDQVKNWFTTNGLEAFTKVFPKFNGITLKGLWSMQQKDYTMFVNAVDKEIEKSKVDVELHDKLNFYQLLQNFFV